MTDDMFPGQDRDSDRLRSPGAAFGGEFGDEPPLTDLVPRALAAYERGRRRRQAAGVGGAVAAVAATVLATTQLLGGAGAGVGPQGSGPVVGAGGKPTAPLTSTPANPPTSSPTKQPAGTTKADPCDQPLALQEAIDTVPVPNQAAARALCLLGMTTMPELLPGHTWLPAPDKFLTTLGTFLPFSFAPDGVADSPLDMTISTKPYFSASCSNVGYSQTTCRSVTLADGTHGIEFDSAPSGEKPGGYELLIDLPGGRQIQYQTGFQAGASQPVKLDAFLALIKSPGFAHYLKQYEAIMRS